MRGDNEELDDIITFLKCVYTCLANGFKLKHNFLFYYTIIPFLFLNYCLVSSLFIFSISLDQFDKKRHIQWCNYDIQIK